jgi:hypothetical protein
MAVVVNAGPLTVRQLLDKLATRHAAAEAQIAKPGGQFRSSPTP